MQYSEEILKKVKSFGVLQYNPEQIITILQVQNRDEFLSDLANETTILYDMYQSGLMSGKYNQDILLFKTGEIDIKIKQAELTKIETENRIYHELFGL